VYDEGKRKLDTAIREYDQAIFDLGILMIAIISLRFAVVDFKA